jgi:hypothetical protein
LFAQKLVYHPPMLVRSAAPHCPLQRSVAVDDHAVNRASLQKQASRTVAAAVVVAHFPFTSNSTPHFDAHAGSVDSGKSVVTGVAVSVVVVMVSKGAISED